MTVTCELQTLTYILSLKAQGKQIMTIEELIKALPLKNQDETNMWYSSSSLLFIGKDKESQYTMITTPAKYVNDFVQFPKLYQDNHNSIKDCSDADLDQVAKHNFKISNQEFLRLLELPTTRVLKFQDFVDHIGSTVGLFAGKTAIQLLTNPFYSLLCGDAGIDLIQKLSALNVGSTLNETYLANLPSDGLIHTICSQLTHEDRCIVNPAVSDYLNQYAVGNEYGIGMVLMTFDRGCQSFQIAIEIGEPDLYRFMFK
jgi:hypothetical protein